MTTLIFFFRVAICFGFFLAWIRAVAWLDDQYNWRPDWLGGVMGYAGLFIVPVLCVFLFGWQ